MNILIVANHFAICSARYATDAFKRLGHDVRHVGPDMGRDIWGLTLPAEYAWKPDSDHEASIPMNGLVILMDSDPRILDLSDRFISAGHTPVVVWGVDNHVRDYRRQFINHYFLAHRNVSLMGAMDWEYISEPGTQYPDRTHLPCAYDPVWFTPSPISFAEREYDVCCLGVMYPKRRELVDAMRKAGLKVLAGTGLIYEAYRDAHHNSRIALCSSVAGDVAQRVFEAAAMGCYILTDYCKDFDILKPKGIRDYSDVPNAVMLAQQVLAKPDFAAEEIARSQAWAKPETWDARAQVIVEWREANYGAS